MSLPAQFRIVIVGGGIAGMASAIALRGPDRHITVLEQSHLNSEIGATISLQPNATRILQKTWGIAGLLTEARGTVDHGFRIFNTEGKCVRELPLLSKTEYEADRIVWHRQDLHGYLKKMATDADREGNPAVVRVSCRVRHCDCENGSVTLENGEMIEGDVIIGADGIHSVLRTKVLGKEIKAVPTGSSAYRLMMPSVKIQKAVPQFCERIHPQDPFTSMIMAHDCRLIMGPARDGELYSLVGLVPDERMNEDPETAQSWVTEGDLSKMLDTYKQFPSWTKDMLRQAESVGLWQLRDLDPLQTWTRGRVILIGDAAHAMLPTQGQGASQAIEDAEALGAFFQQVTGTPSYQEVTALLQDVFACRYTRASLVQRYSREAAKPATDKDSSEVKMRPDEFMDYNCMYKGAKEWQRTQNLSVSSAA